MDDAQKLYKALFQSEVPRTVKDRFVMASSRLSKDFSPDEIQDYNRVLNTVSDLEALELAARYQNKIPYLVHQIQLMVRLAEAVPENRAEFVNAKDRRFRGILLMFWSGIRTVFKLLKGNCLLRKHINV